MKSELQDLLAREQIIKACRTFFDLKSFHEVITPVLNEAIPLEENIYSFKTEWDAVNDAQTFYLPTSPEGNLKKLLAQGIGNCYSIGHSFRNLENSGSLHSPEFLMLEWYREESDYRKIMQDTKELISFIAESQSSLVDERILTNSRWPELSFETLFKEHANIEMEEVCKGEKLLEIAKEKGYSTDKASWSQLFDQIFLNEIEPHLPKEPFFLVDFPARVSPLCKTQANKSYLAERFEVYINGIELGNGNTESLDADFVEEEFTRVSEMRNEKSGMKAEYDHDFIDALRTLQKTGKSYAGIGVGVDRLQWLLSN